jgi:hypothetical protein
VTRVNCVPKLLEDAHIKPAAVASDMMKMSGLAMLAPFLAGHTAPHALADVAQGRLHHILDQVAKALEGRSTPPPRAGLPEL